MKQNLKHSGFSWIGLILLIAIIGGGIYWYEAKSHSSGDEPATASSGGKGGKGGKHGGGANGPMPVTTATAQKGNIPITVNALGTVTPLATVIVRTQIAGQLMQINFKEGQMVKAGSQLALIDPRPYQAALEQAQGTLQRDQALLEGAQRDLDRYTKLVQEDSIAKQQRDDEKALVDQYAGTVATDKATINTAKLNLQYCHITAPVSGRVGLRQIDLGNYAQVSDTNGIVVITQIEPISVIFSLPEDNLPSIMKRMNDDATLTASAYDRSQTTKLADGQLSTVDNVIDPTTGTIKMRALFDNADDTLFANQFVNIVLLVDTLQDVIVIPSTAVKSGAPGTYVYVVKPDSTVAMTPVKTGPASGENISINSGLAVGDVIVTDGADKLKDGAKVLLPGAQGSSDAADKTDGSKKSDDDKKDSGKNKSSGKHHRKNKDKDSGQSGDQQGSAPPANQPVNTQPANAQSGTQSSDKQLTGGQPLAPPGDQLPNNQQPVPQSSGAPQDITQPVGAQPGVVQPNAVPTIDSAPNGQSNGGQPNSQPASGPPASGN
jgi:multidrug efflux system membrane fusion protein